MTGIIGVVGHAALWLAAGGAGVLAVGALLNGWPAPARVLFVAVALFAMSSIGWRRLMLRPLWPTLGVATLAGGLVLLGLQPRPQPAPVTARAVATATAVRAPASAPQATSTAAPKRIGQAVVLTGDRGLRLSLTVNAVSDDVPPVRSGSRPQGRYAVVDWTIKNDGAGDIELNRLDFRVQTDNGYVIQRAGETLREPGLNTDKLGAGQAVRGWLSYDIPSDQRIAAVIYQPSGSRQFVIAELDR